MGEFAAPGVLLTVEHAHRRDVVVAELVAPEELRLIEQIALGEPVVHIAARCRPLDAFLKVEVGVAFLRLLPHGGSRVGIDPLELCLVIEVVDASSGLYKRVVPRHQRTGLQTFQEETQVLLQREVGVDTGGGGLLHARDGQVHNGVGSALRVGGVVTPRAVGVTGHESVVRRTVSGLPQLRLAKRPRGHAPRALFHAVGTEDVGLQCGGVGEPEVKVGAHVDAVEPITGLIAAVVVPPAEHVTLVQKVDRGEIFHKLRTAGDVHIGVVGHGRLSEHHILPVYIRIALGLFQIGRVAVFTDNVHRSHLEPRLGLEAQFVSCGLVADGEGIGTAHRTGELRHRFKRHVHSYFYLGLAFLSAFGGDENHAVGTLHTIDGRGRRVFQYRDALHRGYVDTAHGAFDAVDEHEWVATVPAAHTADDDFRVFLARHTGGRHGDHARQIARQSRTDVAHTAGSLERLARGLGDGAHYTGLLLLTVAHDHSFFEHLGIALHRDVEISSGRGLHLLLQHAHVGHDNRNVALGRLKREVAVKIGHGSDMGIALHDDRRTDERLATFVGHVSLDRERLRPGCHRRQHQQHRCQRNDLKKSVYLFHFYVIRLRLVFAI